MSHCSMTVTLLATFDVLASVNVDVAHHPSVTHSYGIGAALIGYLRYCCSLSCLRLPCCQNFCDALTLDFIAFPIHPL